MISCPPEFNASYCPGYWPQDSITIPIELGLVTYLSYFPIVSAKPLGLFKNESTRFPTREPTRHGPKVLITSGALLSMGGFVMASQLGPENYAFGPIFRGWVHAHLITEIFTLFAKNTFQRKRPFYDAVAKDDPKALRISDRQSFFSGHSSHAFVFATYGSRYVLEVTNGSPWAWAYSSLLLGLASWVGAARALDGQHHWSDVVVGAAVGTTVGLWTASNALSIAGLQNKTNSPNTTTKSTPPNPWTVSYWVTPRGGGIHFIYSL